MLVIRLARVGKKKQPAYRVVVADKRRAATGRFIDIVGHYNPLTDPATVSLNHEEIKAWLEKGAQPSDTVRSLIDHDAGNKPIANSPKNRAKYQKPEAPAAAAEAEAPVAETPEETLTDDSASDEEIQQAAEKIAEEVSQPEPEESVAGTSAESAETDTTPDTEATEAKPAPEDSEETSG